LDNFEELEKTQLHVSHSEQIDRICDDFEAALQKGSDIPMETCLRLVNRSMQTELLRELLEIELEIRKKRNEPLNMETYLSRFPENKKLVEQVFQSVVSPRRLGDYELLELLGHGGMGVVYRARQVYLHQTVAIKILSEQYTEDTHVVSRFLREMQLSGSLKHPNIVQAYYAGETDGVHYLVMEYVAGVTLQRMIAERISRRQGGISIGAACEVIRQAALGLQHAHQRGLVHRDIKPGNLMVDRNGVVKILDLGLGKFQADTRQNDPAGPLTQVGTTMGTVDYMAPEQWDDPTTVGIAADLYSLGCTFYFLLCGQPPFGGKNYETNRAKLMAHIVTEPPLLRDANPNVPRELQEAYLSVMAKEPENRFAEPIELARAVEPFASMEELLETLPEDVLNLAPEGENSSSSMRRSDVDTVVNRNRPPKHRKTLRIPRHQKTWYRHPKLYSGLLLAGAILSLLGFRWYFTASGFRDPSPLPPATPQETFEEKAENAKIAADLVELPGLSGTWWFVEMPWFLPFVREAVGKTLLETNGMQILGADKQGYLHSDTVAVQKWLRKVVENSAVRFSPSQKQLLQDLYTLADTNLLDEEYRRKLEAAYRHYADSPDKKSPSDIHTEAVLLHSLSGWTAHSQDAEKAKEKYETAISRYGKDRSGEISPRLAVFAKTDLGRLNAGALNHFDRFLELFGEASKSEYASPLLKVEILVTRGMTVAGRGKYDDTLFRDAEKELTKIVGKKSHPLKAHIAERYAWSLIDQWKVTESIHYFNTALQIRQANSNEGSNPFADIYVFHNTHGLAMTARYSGDLSHARALYDTVIKDIAQKYEHQTRPSDVPGQLRYYRELRERFSNSMERRADCELFSGAASGAVNVSLVEAEKNYEKASQLSDSRSSRFLIICKLCIVRAMLGKLDAARQTLLELEKDIQTITSSVNRFRAQFALEITGTAIDICSPDTETVSRGMEKLRTFASEYLHMETPADEDRYRRETMEFRLFYMELLLYHSMQKNDAGSETVRKDAKYLTDILMFFENKPETYPFVRRYNDLVIQALGTGDIDQLAHQTAMYRTAEKDFLPGNSLGSASRVYFYFSTQGSNFALFLPGSGDEKRSKRLFPVAFTRRELKQDANRGNKREPDESLAELFRWINESRQEGRIVNIYWDDSSCWPVTQKQQLALTNQDWPFAGICPLRAAEEEPKE
jgi:serine/threonine protein kinase